MDPCKYLRTYKVAEIEKIAHSQIQELKAAHVFTVPVDIELIAERHGIVIDVKRRLKARHGLWGSVGPILDTGQFKIVVDDCLLDQDHLYRMYRMTVAEELAHVLLHGDAIKRVRTEEDFFALQRHAKWAEYDRNAKRLAAAILMPAQSVCDDARDYFEQMVAIIGTGKPEVLKKMIANRLAEDYEVSLNAMKYRLGEWPIRVNEKIDAASRDGLDFLE